MDAESRAAEPVDPDGAELDSGDRAAAHEAWTLGWPIGVVLLGALLLLLTHSFWVSLVLAMIGSAVIVLLRRPLSQVGPYLLELLSW